LCQAAKYSYEMATLDYILPLILKLVLVALSWDVLKKILTKASTILLNSVAGVLILLFVNIYLGWKIPLNAATLLICGLFGLPGIGTLLILYYAKMI
jgi:pro-sigmaK processing inhibitor BofA